MEHEEMGDYPDFEPETTEKHPEPMLTLSPGEEVEDSDPTSDVLGGEREGSDPISSISGIDTEPRMEGKVDTPDLRIDEFLPTYAEHKPASVYKNDFQSYQLTMTDLDIVGLGDEFALVYHLGPEIDRRCKCDSPEFSSEVREYVGSFFDVFDNERRTPVVIGGIESEEELADEVRALAVADRLLYEKSQNMNTSFDSLSSEELDFEVDKRTREAVEQGVEGYALEGQSYDF